MATLKPRMGIVVANWDSARQLGCASRFGIVFGHSSEGVKVRWAATDTTYRPNPNGRRYWVQEKPFFGFAPDVVRRYMLAAAFAEHFLDDIVFDVTPRVSKVSERLPSANPTGGYVYLVKSKYGIKIGKSVNVKSRTRLFEVKLPFPISVEHYAWFDDYSHAERELHAAYHAKRLEGEWFDLSAEDVAHIKTLGTPVETSAL
ncbi:GIY-YIG nuclease family protein [Ralstonia pseudosolanacearum]